MTHQPHQQRAGVMARVLKVAGGAAPPLVSQLTFSAVSFFAVAAASRASDEHQLAAFVATYSIESIAVSYTNARWANLMVFKEPGIARAGDVWHFARVCGTVTGIFLIPLFLTAWLVDRDTTFALVAAAWSGSMLLCDTLRYAASRFLGMRPVAAVGILYLVASVAISFVRMPVVTLLLVLASLSTVTAGVYVLVLRMGRAPGKSKVWTQDREFGRSMGTEAVLSSASTGLGGAIIAWLSPVIAVGLQLGTQILAMPTNVLTSAASLPLARRLREDMDRRSYPRKLILVWAAFSAAVPMVGIALLYLLHPMIKLLLGDQSALAYAFLPAVFLQTLAIQPWLPLTMARRWTHGPNNPRNHVVSTVAIYYLSLIMVAMFIKTQPMQVLLLSILGGAMCISTFVRGLNWYRRGFPVQPRRALPEDQPATSPQQV